MFNDEGRNTEDWRDRLTGSVVYVGPSEKVISLKKRIRELIEDTGCKCVYSTTSQGLLKIVSVSGIERGESNG